MLSMKEPELVDTAGDLYSAFGWAYAIGKGRPSSNYTAPKRVFSNCAGAALYRKAHLEQIGGFDELHFAYLEDVDIGYRAQIFGLKNVTEPAAVVYHAGSGSTGSRYNAFKVTHSSRNNIYLIYKNMPLLQLILNLPFCWRDFDETAVFMKKDLERLTQKESGRESVCLLRKRDVRIRSPLQDEICCIIAVCSYSCGSTCFGVCKR